MSKLTTLPPPETVHTPRYSMSMSKYSMSRSKSFINPNSNSLLVANSNIDAFSDGYPVSERSQAGSIRNITNEPPTGHDLGEAGRVSIDSTKTATRKQPDEAVPEVTPPKRNYSIVSCRSHKKISLSSEDSFVYASSGVVPHDLDDVCVIVPGMEISAAVAPNTVSDVVVARLDRMSPNEQLILKCASVLGVNFTRDLLTAIVPRKLAKVLDTILYRLTKERLIDCGSLAMKQAQQHNQNDIAIDINHRHHHRHHGDVNARHNVLCGCYAEEGEPIVNLSQTNRQDGVKRLCLYFHFSNALVREAAYDLWLEEQRKALHERAAMYLETKEQLCKSCGGNSFLPGIKTKTVNQPSVLVNNTGK